MVDYAKWDTWAKELEEDDSEKEKQFSMDLARMAFEAQQGKPDSSNNVDEYLKNSKKTPEKTPEKNSSEKSC